MEVYKEIMPIENLSLTSEIFLKAWNKYPPSKIELFYFKHFSKSAKDRKASLIVFIILFVPFLMGYIGTMTSANYNFLMIATYTFASLLILFSIPWIIIWYMHNRRIRKIIKYLDCTRVQYETASKHWGYLVK